MDAAAGVISATWRFWEGYEPRLERDVFATTDPSSIVAAADAFCRAGLGSGVDRYEFYSVGVGSTHGVLLDDGRREARLDRAGPTRKSPGPRSFSCTLSPPRSRSRRAVDRPVNAIRPLPRGEQVS
jgi:hypothetical protein